MTEKVDRYKTYANCLLKDPNDARNLVNQFALLLDEGDKSKARQYISLAKRAYAIDPLRIDNAFNYGSALQRAGDLKEAIEVYRKCLKLAKDDDWVARTYHHLGITHRALGENKKAIEYYDKASRATPFQQNIAGFKKDKALALLADGQLVNGFKEFEIRRDIAERRYAEAQGITVTQNKLPANVKHWQGEDLTGKTVVVYHEEGSGDFIMMSRFIPRLRELGAAKIKLTGPVPHLLDLVSDNIEIDGIEPLFDETDFDCDYVLGSMSLPWRVGVEYANVSGKPYFKAETANIPIRGKLNVGLVWRGNPAYGRDVHRSLAFSEFCPLFDLPDAAFYSLQVGPSSSEVTHLGFDGFVADLSSLATTWRRTAKMIAALDVIVTVDTAVAHLAGALGKPVFILVTNSCDWRWDKNSEKSAWYDSARVFRQLKQDDWSRPIALARAGLEAML